MKAPRLHIAVPTSNLLASIEVHASKDGPVFHMALMQRKKKGLSLVATYTETALEALKPYLKKQPSVALTFTGKGVLTRKVQTNELAPAQLLQQVLPNAHSDDFYCHTLAYSSACWVSVVRKEVVDNYLQQLLTMQCFVVSVGVGTLPLVTLHPFLGQQGLLDVAGYQFQLEEGELVSYQSVETGARNYQIEGETFEHTWALAFASGLQHFLNVLPVQPIDSAVLEGLQKEQRQKEIFRFAGMAALVTIFMVLLFNFLIFDHYSGIYQELESASNMNKEQLQQLELLEGELAQKQALLRSTGLMNTSALAYYSDQIALSTPEGIQLSELNDFPLEQELSEGEQPHFESGTIRIVGTTNQSTVLNDWVKRLKARPWVAHVTIVNYKRSKNNGTFQLNVHVE